MKDLLGEAIWDFYHKKDFGVVKTKTDISFYEAFPIDYFFRSFAQMPKLEQKALELCQGKILDVGCGAGSHSLYLQEKGFEVTSIDISEKAIEVTQKRGVKNAFVQDFFTFEEKFDTILLLMNGAGICKRLENIDFFMQKLKSLLNEGGQVLTDSSDLIYMFKKNKDGSYNVPILHNYYGEVDFSVKYKGEIQTFEWLFIDYNTLERASLQNDLNCQLIQEGNHFDYLAKIYL